MLYGINLNQSPYPWLSDPAVTDAWIAEKEYMTVATGVSSWAPHKGTIPLVQATGGNQPIFTSNNWSGNNGLVTFDGVAQYLTGDALAAKITGNDVPFSFCCSLLIPVVATGKNLLGFGGTSANTFHVFQVVSASGTKFRLNRGDDIGASAFGTVSTVLPSDYVQVVMTVLFTGTTTTVRINGVTTDVNATSQNVGSCTFSAFTMGGWRNTSAPSLGNVAVRAFAFGPSVWSAGTYTAIENYLLREINNPRIRPLHQYFTSVPVLQSVQSDLGITLNGSNVSAWADQSGNGKDFSQATGGSQPVYNASGLNGLPTVGFTSPQFLTSSLTRGAAGSNPVTVLAIYRTDTWHAVGSLDVAWTDGGGSGLTFIADNVSPNMHSQVGAAASVNGGAPVGTWVRVIQYANNTTNSYLQLGATKVTGNSGNNAIATTASLLGFSTSGRTISMTLAARIMLGGLPTTSELDAFNCAVLAKYGTGVLI